MLPPDGTVEGAVCGTGLQWCIQGRDKLREGSPSVEDTILVEDQGNIL